MKANPNWIDRVRLRPRMHGRWACDLCIGTRILSQHASLRAACDELIELRVAFLRRIGGGA